MHPEVIAGTAEKDRRKLAAVHFALIKIMPRSGEHVQFLHGLAQSVFFHVFLHEVIVQTTDMFRRTEGSPRRALEQVHRGISAIIDAGKTIAQTERPVHRCGADAEHRLEFVDQLQRRAGRTVELVHEGENGHPAFATHFKELASLRLDPLPCVDDHDRGINSREHAVGVFRKVLVARCIEQVHHAATVFELEHRGRDRDSALLFQLHPVTRGSPLILPRRHRASQLNSTPVEEQFLRESGLARIRMGNDGKGAAAIDFLSWRHDGGTKCIKPSLWRLASHEMPPNWLSTEKLTNLRQFATHHFGHLHNSDRKIQPNEGMLRK